MSAMEDMAANLLKKVMPPDFIEQVKIFVQGMQQGLANVQKQLDRIEHNTNVIMSGGYSIGERMLLSDGMIEDKPPLDVLMKEDQPRIEINGGSGSQSGAGQSLPGWEQFNER